MAGRSPLDGTELEGLLEDLTDGSNVHRGIRLLAEGFRAIAEDQTLDIPGTQLVIAQLCGNADVDTITIIGALHAWLTDPATNPALRSLPDDVRKTVQHQGELAHYALADPDLRQPAATACVALDHTERRCTDMSRLTDKEKENLSKKVKEVNDWSKNRPR
jgi:hypothetical protein